ncbi:MULTISPECIES: F0F1 ATP synthase subunit B [Streptococcus]|uniref:ATP synthase subunit b n=1 Tax=Streptococcus dentalis TaxID=3098075 RepID=A0ABZ0SY44_9STRE|nr:MULTISPECIES: F0F1 ATP synthase subunit B [Streptococcus]AGY37879.1 F0F1 ATP synthase subunit B [Streptococcus ilei]RJU25272.1 ATP synthase F0 subunit B [Streptococcus sp. AM43-2AT]WPS53691.1 F0F1 ATP synthase subunit B [Streptococcus sp. S1]
MDLTIGTIIGDFILIAGSFLLLIFLVKKYAWGNITSILDARAEKITNDIDEAEAARQKAEELASKREEELAGSRKEAASIVENAKETAEKNKSQILSEATQEAVRLKEKAQQEIAHNKEEALNSIKGDVADLTVNLASKLLSQQLDTEGQRQLIDRYLDELGEA